MHLLKQMRTKSMNRITLEVKTHVLPMNCPNQQSLSRLSATFCLISHARFRNVKALQKLHKPICQISASASVFAIMRSLSGFRRSRSKHIKCMI